MQPTPTKPLHRERTKSLGWLSIRFVPAFALTVSLWLFRSRKAQRATAVPAGCPSLATTTRRGVAVVPRIVDCHVYSTPRRGCNTVASQSSAITAPSLSPRLAGQPHRPRSPSIPGRPPRQRPAAADLPWSIVDKHDDATSRVTFQRISATPSYFTPAFDSPGLSVAASFDEGARKNRLGATQTRTFYLPPRGQKLGFGAPLPHSIALLPTLPSVLHGVSMGCTCRLSSAESAGTGVPQAVYDGRHEQGRMAEGFTNSTLFLIVGYLPGAWARELAAAYWGQQ